MKIKYVLTLTVIAFLLHLVWENSQAFLYINYQSFAQHFPICFVGTFGDVIITLFVLVFLWLIKKDRVQTITDFIALGIIGFIIAVVIEQHALLVDKWNYALAMPIIPVLEVGLTPIIQMTLLLPLTFYLAGLFNKKNLL